MYNDIMFKSNYKIKLISLLIVFFVESSISYGQYYYNYDYNNYNWSYDNYKNYDLNYNYNYNYNYNSENDWKFNPSYLNTYQSNYNHNYYNYNSNYSYYTPYTSYSNSNFYSDNSNFYYDFNSQNTQTNQTNQNNQNNINSFINNLNNSNINPYQNYQNYQNNWQWTNYNPTNYNNNFDSSNYYNGYNNYNNTYYLPYLNFNNNFNNQIYNQNQQNNTNNNQYNSTYDSTINYFDSLGFNSSNYDYNNYNYNSNFNFLNYYNGNFQNLNSFYQNVNNNSNFFDNNNQNTASQNQNFNTQSQADFNLSGLKFSINKTTFSLTDTWQLSLTGAPANQRVTICAISNLGIQSCSYAKDLGLNDLTDSFGNWSASGNWIKNGVPDESVIGNWTEWIVVGAEFIDNQFIGGIKSNTINFTIFNHNSNSNINNNNIDNNSNNINTNTNTNINSNIDNSNNNNLINNNTINFNISQLAQNMISNNIKNSCGPQCEQFLTSNNQNFVSNVNITKINSIDIPNAPSRNSPKLAADWDKDELYVAVGNNFFVIDTNNWSIKKSFDFGIPPPWDMVYGAEDLCLTKEKHLVAGVIKTSTKFGVMLFDLNNNISKWMDFANSNFSKSFSGPSPLSYVSSCDFSQDGNILYLASNLAGSPEIPKIFAVDVFSGEVIKYWTINENSVSDIKTLPDNGVYVSTSDMLSFLTSNPKGDLMIIDNNFNLYSSGLNIVPFSPISISPDNKYAYIKGRKENYSVIFVIDINSNRVIKEIPTTPFSVPTYLKFSSPQENYFIYAAHSYVSTPRVEIINIFDNSKITIYESNEKLFGMEVEQQSNHNDLLVLLGDGKLDIFNITPPRLMIYNVVNGASFIDDGAFSPGEWVSIFGKDLASQTLSADRVPFFNKLGKTMVYIKTDNNLTFYTPISFISPNQINIQIPYEVPIGSKFDIYIQEDKDGGVIVNYTKKLFNIREATPALFMYNNMPIITDINGQLISSVKRGQIITMYGTGFGGVNPQVQSGHPAPFNPLSKTIYTPEILIGGQQAELLYSGLSPGWVGLYQLNIKIPENIPTGLQNMIINQAGFNSPIYNIMITD
jgi:uncharacterized protein (TIGR03437 family)